MNEWIKKSINIRIRSVAFSDDQKSLEKSQNNNHKLGISAYFDKVVDNNGGKIRIMVIIGDGW